MARRAEDGEREAQRPLKRMVWEFRKEMVVVVVVMLNRALAGELEKSGQV